MGEDKKTLVMKFGGAAVETIEGFSSIADLIIEREKNYSRIAIVVSAMKGMTDHLISLAYKVHSNPPRREYDMLVSVGERVSISLLAMALALKGKTAVSFTGSQSGIITTSEHSEARIIDVKPTRLEQIINEKKIVIVAGFQGVSLEKEITTLGRGGSDTTAVALGVALEAEKVEFCKDVDGIFDQDPKKFPNSKVFSQLNYDEAEQIILETGGRVLHPRALQLAKRNNLPLHIHSFFHAESGTWIGNAIAKRSNTRLYEISDVCN